MTWGEEYFRQKLIDYDAASNVHGWQWSASTGTDAVPYFRMFNPVRQSERFDKKALYIKNLYRHLMMLMLNIYTIPINMSAKLKNKVLS